MDLRNNIVKNLVGYTPGEQPQDHSLWIKLNTNEFPFEPSKKINNFFQSVSLHSLKKYPSPEGEPLRTMLHKFYAIPKESILINNGSDEGLQLICKTFLNLDDKIITPKITYSLYSLLVKANGGVYQECDMKNNFEVNLQDLENSDAKIVFLANPNANTGEFIPIEQLKKVIKNSNKLWVIDEAYNDFVDSSQASMLPFTKELFNLIVTRSFSKSYGLAGIRLGFLVSGNITYLKSMMALKDSYNIDYLAVQIGSIALQDMDYYQNCLNIINKNKKYLTHELTKLGYDVLPSQANFILTKPKIHTSLFVYQYLKEKKILVRHFSKSHIDAFIRISIGTKQECSQIIQELQKLT